MSTNSKKISSRSNTNRSRARNPLKGGKGRKTYKKMVKRSRRSYKHVMQHGG